MAEKAKYFTQISNFIDYVLLFEKDEMTGELLVSRLTPIEKELFRHINRYPELFEGSENLAIKMNVSEGALSAAKKRLQFPTVQFGKPLVYLRKEKTNGGGKDRDCISCNIEVSEMTKFMRQIVKFCAENKLDPYIKTYQQCKLTSNRTTSFSEFATSFNEVALGRISLSTTSFSEMNNNNQDSLKKTKIKNNQKIVDCGSVENSSSFQQSHESEMNDFLIQDEEEEEWSYQEKIDIMKTWGDIHLSTPILKKLGNVPWKELIYCKETTLMNKPTSNQGYFISLINGKAYQKTKNITINRKISSEALQKGWCRNGKLMKTVFRLDANDRYSSINLELPPQTFKEMLRKSIEV